LESPADTELIFEDECSFSNTATVSYQWSRKGQQPQIPCKQRKRERQTLFGSYNYGTGQMTVDFEDKGNTATFKKHLKKVCRKYPASSKIIMVLDNARFHHAKKIQTWLATQDRLELVFLPPYSPELNAVERAWWYMRKKITHNRYMKTMEQRKIEFWKMFSHFEQPNEKLKKICVVNY
jgi:transposase